MPSTIDTADPQSPATTLTPAMAAILEYHLECHTIPSPPSKLIPPSASSKWFPCFPLRKMEVWDFNSLKAQKTIIR